MHNSFISSFARSLVVFSRTYNKLYFRLQRALEINQLIKIMQIIIVNLATGHLSQNWHGRGISFAIVPDHYYSWWQLKTLIVNRKLPICSYIEKHYWYKTICLQRFSFIFTTILSDLKNGFINYNPTTISVSF